MKPLIITESAAAMQQILTQILNSAHALSTEDEDLLADIGAKEGARLTRSIEEFFTSLPAFASACGASTAGDLGPAEGAGKLAAAAQEIVRQDSNHLQIMGRAFLGREEERLRRELAAIPHLAAALAALQP